MSCAEVENLFVVCTKDIIKYWQECKNEAILLGFILVLLRFAYNIFEVKSKKQKLEMRQIINIKEIIILFSDGIYIAYLLYVTLGMRHVGQFQKVNLMIFNIESVEIQFVIENFLLFIPFGVLCPMTFAFYRRVGRVIVFALFSSLIIEILQYYFCCGKSEIDDIILNSTGALAGYFIFKCLYFLTQNLNAKSSKFL